MPSAVAAIALVPAVAWLAWLLAGRAAALVAGLLVVASPLALQYAQQARPYAMVMFTGTLAVALALTADRAPRRRLAWLAASAALAVCALWLHYTAVFVVAPLCVWVATRPWAAGRARSAYLATCAVAWVVWMPLARDQIRIEGGGGIPGAELTWRNLVKLLGTPFDGRDYRHGVTVVHVLAAVLTVAAVVAVAAWAGARLRDRGLLAALAAALPFGLIVLAIFGKHVAITRYSAAAMPFMVVAIAAVATSLPRRAAASGACALALGLALAGTVASHGSSGQNADFRSVMATVAASARPGDVVVSGQGIGLTTITYYAQRHRLLQRHVELVDGGSNQPAFAAAVRRRARIWAVSDEPGPRSAAAGTLAQIGYRALVVRTFAANVSLQVVLAAPSG